MDACDTDLSQPARHHTPLPAWTPPWHSTRLPASHYCTVLACARHFRCMQGDVLAAAARTANSDQPLPMSQPSLPCPRPPFQSSPHSQRRRASHLACACHTLTHSPTPTAGCRLSLSSPALLLLLPLPLLASSPPPPPPPAGTSSLFPSRACAWVCVGAAPPHKCSAHQPAPPS